MPLHALHTHKPKTENEKAVEDWDFACFSAIFSLTHTQTARKRLDFELKLDREDKAHKQDAQDIYYYIISRVWKGIKEEKKSDYKTMID